MWRALFRADMPVDPYPSNGSNESSGIKIRNREKKDTWIWYRRKKVYDKIREIYRREAIRSLEFAGIGPEEGRKRDATELTIGTEEYGNLNNDRIAEWFEKNYPPSVSVTAATDSWEITRQAFAMFHQLSEGPGFGARVRLGAITLTAADHNRIFEFKDATELLLPRVADVGVGFQAVVANRVPVGSGNILVRPSLGEQINGQNQIEIPFDRSVVIRTGGTRWEVYDESRVDFHGAVTMVGQYPPLLRQLGLAVDLFLDASILGIKGSVTGRIAVFPELQVNSDTIIHWRSEFESTRNVSPWTHFEVRPARSIEGMTAIFITQPEGRDQEEITLSMLKLGGHDRIALDVDGAILKKQNQELRPDALSQLVRQAGAARQEDHAALPALRSAGISLSRDLFPWAITQSVEKNTKFEEQLGATPAINMTATHDGNLIEFYAEDLISGYRIDVGLGNGKWLTLCERNLSFTYPSEFGQPRTWAPKGTDEGFVSTAASEADAGQERKARRVSETLFKWDGWSLVVPRPGRPAADNGTFDYPSKDPPKEFPLTVDMSVPEASLPPLRYRSRYFFRARAVDLAGNSWSVDEATKILTENSAPGIVSGEVVFLRHEPVTPPLIIPLQQVPQAKKGDYLVIRSFNDGRTEAHRWVVFPPQLGLSAAEQHGMLDDLADGDSAWTVLKAHSRGIPSDFDEKFIDSLARGSAGRLVPPYFPDPLCYAALFHGLPGREVSGDEMSVESFPFEVERKGPSVGRSYALAFELELRNGERRTDRTRRGLRLFLPPGEQRSVFLSSQLPPDGHTWFAFWEWLNSEPESTRVLSKTLISYQKVFSSGQAWIVSPSREIRLVHAVQRPICSPEISQVKAERELGNPTAKLALNIRFHRGSTGQIDFIGEWQEHVDDISLPDWTIVSQQSSAFSVTVKQPNLIPKSTTSSDAIEEEHFEGAHQFTDTRYRRVRYTGVATSRFAEYFPEIDAKEKSCRSTEVYTDIPNSASPKAINLEYIVPLFRWAKSRTGTLHRSSRFGGGLRIYMRRPWFSSGDGEALAIVLPSSVGFAIPSTLRLSDWGSDPIRGGGGIKRAIRLDDFTYAIEWVRGVESLAVEETNAGGRLQTDAPSVVKYDIATFPVQVDRESGLLFSDVKINSPIEYFPFVRLALARWQPKSVRLAHLSPIQIADFVQLTPDRLATVDRATTRPSSISVSIIGPGPFAQVGLTNMIEVGVERESYSLGGAGAELAWIPDDESPKQTLNPRRLPDGQWSWQGNIPLHFGFRRRRISIKEFETLETDDKNRADHSKPNLVRRLVYSDTIELD
jgi:hypothetical protein